ncbi:MAG TPA: hypothetical protein VN711_03045 [Candidatus Saccharimonadales bacterium]|nr:hypothetical protein [Candidatus Saccharimonadales bacterium]
MPIQTQDYQQLLTEVIKKQIVILGPDITLSKARNVKGLTIADDGTVTKVEGSPQEIIQALIDQFVQLSGLIVKKTMEPLLMATQQISDGTIPQAAPVLPTTSGSPAPTFATNTTPAPVAVVQPVGPTPGDAQPVVPAPPVPQTEPQPTLSIPPVQPAPFVPAPTEQPASPQVPPAPTAPQPIPTEQPVAQPTQNPNPSQQTTAPADNPLAA